MDTVHQITKDYIHKILPTRKQDSHKGTYGSVLNIAGSLNYKGAAYLSSVAPLKTGAGYVTLTSLKEVTDTVSVKSSEIVLYPLENEAGTLSSANVDLVLKLVDKHNIISLGCGLSDLTNTDNYADFVEEFLDRVKDYNNIFIIDADALNAISERKITKLPKKCILTPHPKELARLIDTAVDKIQSNRIIAVEKATSIYNCIVVLKGYQTLISDGQKIYINNTGNSSLAKAGTGDVLTGTISGFAAQVKNPLQSALLGVYLHGRAGELASENLTEYGVLATDILEYLPVAINEVLKTDLSH